MWIIYVILAFLLLSIIAKVQEYNSQKKEKEERENRIRKNVQTGAFDCKKEIFHNLYIINTGGCCCNRFDFNFIVEGGKTGFSDKTGRIIVPQKFDAVRNFKGHYAVTVIDGKFGLFYYNEQGVELASCVYENLEENKDSIHVWRKNNSSLTCCNSQCQLDDYDSIRTNGYSDYIIAKKSNTVFVVNIKEQRNILRLDNADIVMDTDFLICTKYNGKCIYDLNGKLLFQDIFKDIKIIMDYPGGLTRPKEYYFYCVNDIGNKIIYDIQGKHTNDYNIRNIKYVDFPHSYKTKFTSKMFVCEDSNGKWGGININMDLLIHFVYDEISIYRNYVSLKKGVKYYTYYYDLLLGPFDKIENEYKSLLLYNGATFRIFNLYGGYKLHDNIFESYEKIPGGHDLYKLKSNKKYGLFSKDFHQYFAPCYDDIISYQTEKCICLQNGKYGVVDSLNNILLPFKYVAIEDIEKDWLEYCRCQIIKNPKMAFIYEEFLPKKMNLQKLDAEDGLLSLLNNTNEKYLFLDTEVVGSVKTLDMPIEMSDFWPRIFQIGWIITDKESHVIKEKNYLIKPIGFVIPNETAIVHGVTNDVALKFGSNLKDVLLELHKDIQSSNAIIGHNIEYDLKVICAEFYRLNYIFVYNKKKIYDTMKSGAYLAEMNSKWPKLQELYKVLFGHSFEGAHNAMADVVATKDCFWEMVRLRKILLSSSSRNNAVMNYDDNVNLPF